MREERFAVVVLVALALFAGFTVLSRMREGRCGMGGGPGRTGRALNCTYPAGTFPRPQ